MTTHSSIFAWEIPWTEEPGELQSIWSQELDTTNQACLLAFLTEKDALVLKEPTSLENPKNFACGFFLHAS